MAGWTESGKKASLPGEAPLVAHEKARIIWFERYGSAIVEKNRYFVLVVLLGLVVLALGLTLFFIMPLKTVVPYVVRVASNGNVAVDVAASRRYVPGQSEQTYFLAHWAEKLLTVDGVLSPPYLREAYSFTRGKAIEEFTDFVRATQPLEAVKADSSLTQSVTLRSINYLEAGVALVRVSTERRSLSAAPLTKNYAITIHFVIVAPDTEAEILSNPIGLYVTDFNLTRDLS